MYERVKKISDFESLFLVPSMYTLALTHTVHAIHDSKLRITTEHAHVRGRCRVPKSKRTVVGMLKWQK